MFVRGSGSAGTENYEYLKLRQWSEKIVQKFLIAFVVPAEYFMSRGRRGEKIASEHKREKIVA